MDAAPLDTDVAIETAEHIVFHYRAAGPARRALAYLIDLFVCYGVVLVIAFIVIMLALSDATLETVVGALVGLRFGTKEAQGAVAVVAEKHADDASPPIAQLIREGIDALT